MTNTGEPREHVHDATGSPRQPGRMFVPGLSRRRFLQYTGLGAAAAAVAGISGGPVAAAVGGSSTAAKSLPEGLDRDHRRREARGDPHAGEPVLRPLLRDAAGSPRASATSRSSPTRTGTTSSSSPTRPARTSGTCSPTTSPTRSTATSTTAGTATTRPGTAGCGTTGFRPRPKRRWATSPGTRSRSSTRSPTPSPSATATTRRSWRPPAPTGCTSGPARRRGWTSNPNDYEVDFGPDAGTPEVTTYPELLQAAGISWQVYTNDQVGDSGSYPDYFLGDYGDNPLWFYQQYNTTNSRNGGTGQLATRGGGHALADRRGGAAAEQDPRRVRAVLVHQGRQQQHPAPRCRGSSPRPATASTPPTPPTTAPTTSTPCCRRCSRTPTCGRPRRCSSPTTSTTGSSTTSSRPTPRRPSPTSTSRGCRSAPGPGSRCSSARRGPAAATSTPTSTTTPRCSSSWPPGPG